MNVYDLVTKTKYLQLKPSSNQQYWPLDYLKYGYFRSILANCLMDFMVRRNKKVGIKKIGHFGWVFADAVINRKIRKKQTSNSATNAGILDPVWVMQHEI